MHFGTQRVARVVISALLFFSLPTVNADDRANRVLTVPIPDGGQPVVAKSDAERGIHLLYNTADGPRYAKSTDNGKSFGAAIPVIVGLESLKVDSRLTFDGCDMALGRGGRIHVALTSPNAWKLKVPQNEWGFYYASLEPGAKVFSPVRKVNGKPSEGFSLAADDKGNVSACWLADKLYANVSHDDGKTFSPIVEINPAYDPCNCCTTNAVYGADGKLAVLYREETNNDRDMFLVLWDQERSQMSRTRISSTLWNINACPMTYYSVAPAPGGFVAAWPTKSQIHFARLDQTGKVLAPGEIKTPGMAGHRTGVLALSAPDGSTLVAWAKDNQLGWQLYNSTGQPSGSPGSAKSSGNGVAGVVGREGQFILFR